MTALPRVLIVDDEPLLLRGLSDTLTYHGYQVETAVTGAQGLDFALNGYYDLIILDIMLPELDGFNVCSRIRERNRQVAIIFLTAKGSDQDIVNGFTSGGDDYVTKPFLISELVLRVQAVLRRSSRDFSALHSFRLDSTLACDLDSLVCRKTSSNNSPELITLTQREADILRYLHTNSSRAISRGELLSRIWGYKRAGSIDTRTVDIHIAKLRKKIEKDPKNPSFLVTVRNQGYQLLSLEAQENSPLSPDDQDRAA